MYYLYILYILYIFRFLIYYMYYRYNDMYTNDPLLGFEIKLSHLNFMGCGFPVLLS